MHGEDVHGEPRRLLGLHLTTWYLCENNDLRTPYQGVMQSPRGELVDHFVGTCPTSKCVLVPNAWYTP